MGSYTLYLDITKSKGTSDKFVISGHMEARNFNVVPSIANFVICALHRGSTSLQCSDGESKC